MTKPTPKLPATILTDAIIKNIPIPPSGFVIQRDLKQPGFGVKVYSGGVRTFVLIIKTAGKKTVHTVGRVGPWQLGAARDAAKKLAARIRDGHDPAKARAEAAAAAAKEAAESRTVNDLCDAFAAVYIPKKRAKTQDGYLRLLRMDVRPGLGKKKIRDVTSADLERQLAVIHARAPKSGNEFLAVVSRMWTWGQRYRGPNGTDDPWAGPVNPARGIARQDLIADVKPLEPAQRKALFDALVEFEKEDPTIADYFRLLMYTGARSGETKRATWDQFSGGFVRWTKPSSETKQATLHRVRLSPPAIALLSKRRRAADAELRRLAKAIPAAEEKLKRLEQKISRTNDPDRVAALEKIRGDRLKVILRLKERRDNVGTFVFPAGKNYLRDGRVGYLTTAKNSWHKIALMACLSKSVKVNGKVKTRHTVRIHDLRHLAISLMVGRGVPLATAGKIVGHSTMATTERYAHLLDGDESDAVTLLGEALTEKVAAE